MYTDEQQLAHSVKQMGISSSAGGAGIENRENQPPAPRQAQAGGEPMEGVATGRPLFITKPTPPAPPPPVVAAASSVDAELARENQLEQATKREVCTVLPAGYSLSQCLAEGAMGRVYLVYNAATKDMLAAKVVCTRDSSKIRDETKREADLQRRLSHPHVCAVYGYRNTPRFCVIFMELVSGGELFDRIPIGTGLKAHQAFIYYAQILDALNYLHRQGVAHLDVKPENVMVSKRERAKLIDFGWAVDLKLRSTITGQSGTVTYAAPEVFTNQPYRGPPADLFSLAITLMTMVTGERCWHRAVNTDTAFRCWTRRQFELAPFNRLPPDMLSFLIGALEQRPKCRLDHAGIVQSPWYRRGLAGKLSPVAPPRNHPQSAVHADVSSSQPVELTPDEMTTPYPLCDISYSQPCDTSDMLIQAGESCSQSGFHISTLMRRMTRFFSNFPADKTVELLCSLLDTHSNLRCSVKSANNLLVELRTPEQPTSFRILLYSFAGGLLVDFRRASGDGLRFHRLFLQLLAGMRSLDAVNDQHPYLRLVLPEQSADSTDDNACLPPSQSGALEGLRMQSVT